MDCRAIAELMDLYVDGALAEEQCAAVGRHLMRCERCAFEVRALEQTRSHLRDAMPSVESNPAFREKMIARLNHEFADVLRQEPVVPESQWALPFLRDNP